MTKGIEQGRCRAAILASALVSFVVLHSEAQPTLYEPNATIPAPQGTGPLPDNFAGVTAIDQRTAIFSTNEGPLYVYERRQPTQWSREATISLPEPYSFGGRIALDDGVAAVSAFTDGGLMGAVFIFHQAEDQWTLAQTLTSPPGFEQNFGASLALEGDTLVIAAPLPQEGRVFIYRRTSGTFELAEELPVTATDVALSLPTLMVNDSSFGEQLYAVHVYDLSRTPARRTQTLTPSDPAFITSFGEGLAVHGNIAVIGAPHSHESGQFGAGGIAIFQRRAGTWREVALIENPEDGGLFGSEVATEGRYVLANAAFIGDPTGQNAVSRVYVFERQEGAWPLIGGLTAPHCTNGFGTGFSLSRGVLITGDQTANTPDPLMDGEGYVFTLNQLQPARDLACGP